MKNFNVQYPSLWIKKNSYVGTEQWSMWSMRRCISFRFTTSTWSWWYVCKGNHIEILCGWPSKKFTHFFRIIFLFKSTNWNAISPFRQLRLKLNWRQIIKDTSRSPYVQIIIHKLKPIKTVSTSIHWRLRMLKIINFSYLTRLENGEFSNIESNYRHSWLVHNAFCSGHTTQEICGAHAQMAQNPSVAENQVKLNSIHFSIICSEKKSRFSLSNICLSVDSVTIKTTRINRCYFHQQRVILYVDKVIF